MTTDYGTPAAYHAYFDVSAVPVVVSPSGPAGTPESIAVPPGTLSVAIQAVDDAGNLGPRVRSCRSPGDAGLVLLPALIALARRRGKRSLAASSSRGS